MKKKKKKTRKRKKFSTGFLHKCTKNGVFWQEYASFPHNPQTFPQFCTGCGKGCGKLFFAQKCRKRFDKQGNLWYNSVEKRKKLVKSGR
jgi:hypothetical protein